MLTSEIARRTADITAAPAISIYDKVQGFDMAGAAVMSAVLLAISLVSITLTFWLSARVGRRLS